MATIQEDKEPLRSDSNSDRQECPSYAEDNNEERQRGMVHITGEMRVVGC